MLFVLGGERVGHAIAGPVATARVPVNGVAVRHSVLDEPSHGPRAAHCIEKAPVGDAHLGRQALTLRHDLEGLRKRFARAAVGRADDEDGHAGEGGALPLDQRLERGRHRIHREDVVGAGEKDDQIVATRLEHLGIERGVLGGLRPRVERPDPEGVDDDAGCGALERDAHEPGHGGAARDELQAMRALRDIDPLDAEAGAALGGAPRDLGLDATFRDAVDDRIEAAAARAPQIEDLEACDARADRRRLCCGLDERRRALPLVLHHDPAEAVEPVPCRRGAHRVGLPPGDDAVTYVAVLVVAPRLAGGDEPVASFAERLGQDAAHATRRKIHRQVGVAVDRDPYVIARQLAVQRGERVEEGREGLGALDRHGRRRVERCEQRPQIGLARGARLLVGRRGGEDHRGRCRDRGDRGGR